MPIRASAKKKLRQDKKRRIRNRDVLEKMKKALRIARTKPTPKNLASAASSIDTAAKKGVIHKNKAARLKSRWGQKRTSTSALKMKNSP